MVNLGSLWQSLPKLHRTLLGRRNHEKSPLSAAPRSSHRQPSNQHSPCGCYQEAELEDDHYSPYRPIHPPGKVPLTSVPIFVEKRRRLGAQDNSNLLMTTSCSSTTSSRSNIRTNPWISPSPLTVRRPEVPQASNPKELCTGSERSSGYGSHDSSPSCSVHSPDWSSKSIKQHEDVALQCSMTEDKAVSCTEADFINEDDEDWLEDSLDEDRFHWRVFGRPWVMDNNASTYGIIEELNDKLIRVKIKSDALKVAVERLRREQAEREAQKPKPAIPECRYPLQPIRFTMTTFEVAL